MILDGVPEQKSISIRELLLLIEAGEVNARLVGRLEEEQHQQQQKEKLEDD